MKRTPRKSRGKQTRTITAAAAAAAARACWWCYLGAGSLGVWPCSSLSCWVALTCSACTSVGPLQPLRLPLIFLPPATQLPPHSQPMPLCITAVPLRCPHNQIVRPKQSFFGLPTGPLLAASSLGAQPVPLLLAGSDGCQLLLGCRRGLLSGIPPWEQPVLGLGLLLLRLRLPGAGTKGGAGGTSHCLWPAATRKGLISPTPHNPAGSK